MMVEILHWVIAIALCVFAVAMGAVYEEEKDGSSFAIGIILALLACALMRYA